MPLVIPRIHGPISTLSSVIHLTGHLPGATVTVVGSLSGATRVVAIGKPDSAFEGLLALVPGIVLSPGERLAASQETEADKSGLSPDDMRLQVLGLPRTSDVGAVSVLTHPYRCGECLYIHGAFPGALVGLYERSGAPRGAPAEAIGTVARLSFSPGLDDPDLVVRQQIGPLTALRDVPIGRPDDPPTIDKRPPAPRIAGSVMECDAAVLIEDILAGSVVEVSQLHRGQLFPAIGRHCVDLSAVRWGANDVKSGDELRVRQTLCGVPSPWSEPATRVGLLAVGRPWLLPPCDQDVFVCVFGLNPGSVVTLELAESDGALVDTIQGGAYAGESKFIVPGGTLRQARRLRARQTVCGREGAWSPEVLVTPGLGAPEPEIVGPLFECATRVRVKGVPRGAVVRLFSYAARLASDAFGCIGEAIAASFPDSTNPGAIDVDVVALTDGDWIEATVARCGQAASRSVLVQRLGDVPAPTLDPVTPCGPIVARGLVPGAVVELYLDGIAVGEPEVSPVDHHVFFPPAALATGVSVHVVERICGVERSSTARTAQPGTLALASSLPPFQSSKRLQQITGATDLDPSAKLPHPVDTWTRHLLPGMDLGVPVEHLGRLYLFFGDSRQYFGDTPGPWIRPIAVTDYLEPFSVGREWKPSLSLNFLHRPDKFLGETQLLPLRVLDPGGPGKPPRIPEDDTFFVPTGGFSYGGSVHVFVSEKARVPEIPDIGFVGLPAVSEAALARWELTNYAVDPPSGPGAGLVGGRSVLASSSDPREPFTSVEVFDARNVAFDDLLEEWKFSHVSPLVVDAGTIPGLRHPDGTPATGDALLLWGTGAYRRSDVCMAWVPLRPGAPIPDVSEWQFFAGLDSRGEPTFTSGMRSAIGLLSWSDGNPTSTVTNYRGRGLKADGWPVPLPYEIGEFSVTYVAQMRSWLMLYGGATGRISSTPWGPWRPLGLGAVLYHAPDQDPAVAIAAGTGMYAPYGLSRFYRYNTEKNAVRIYFLASFLGKPPHGSVHLFQADLQCKASV